MEAVTDFVRTGANSNPDAEKAAVDALLARCPFPTLFDLVASAEEDSEAQRTVLAALCRLYESPGGVEFLASTEENLLVGAKAPSKRIRATTLKVLGSLARSSGASVLGRERLVGALVAGVGDPEVGLAELASHAIAAAASQLAAQPSSLVAGAETMARALASSVRSAALGPEAGSTDQRSQCGEVVLLRLADLAVSLALTPGAPQGGGAGLPWFGLAAEEGLLDLVKGLVQKDDPLVQLAAMDLIGRLASGGAASVAFLFRGGLARWLVSLADGLPPDASGLGAGLGAGGADSSSAGPDPILGGGALRLMGLMLSLPGGAAEAERDEPGLVMRFLKAAIVFGDARDESANLASVEAVAHLASSSRANLELVLGDPLLTRSWLTLPSRTHHKAAVLHSIAHALSPRLESSTPFAAAGGGGLSPGDLPQPPVTEGNPAFSGHPPAAQASAPSLEGSAAGEGPEEEEEARKRLWLAFGRCNGCMPGEGQGEGQAVGLLVDMARRPIPEVKHAAYDFLRALAKDEWGLTAMYGYGGFAEFVENRFTEDTKEGKEWKFATIEALAANPKMGAVSPERSEALQRMLSEGPFYVPYRPQGPLVAEPV